MERLLDRIYYDLKSPALYGGVNSVYREAKLHIPSIRLKDVTEYLQKQYTYSIHKPARRRYPRNKVMAPGPNHQFQIDLSDMSTLSDQNDGYKHMLTCIDVFSKYAWAIPVKNKSADEIVRAFSEIIKDKKPELVQSDEGKEFLNKKFQDLLKQNAINFFTSKNREIKCSVVERFNRTIKNKIWKHFSTTRKYRYIDDLQKIVEGYNNSYHRSIKMKPREVNASNAHIVRRNLYGSSGPDLRFKFNVGDKVRVSKAKGTFEKGYLPNWSEEIFHILRRVPKNPPVYQLKDYNGKTIDGFWYATELQKVVQEKFWIEKIIKRLKNKSLIKWVGYSDEFNSWVPNKDIKQYG